MKFGENCFRVIELLSSHLKKQWLFGIVIFVILLATLFFFRGNIYTLNLLQLKEATGVLFAHTSQIESMTALKNNYFCCCRIARLINPRMTQPFVLFNRAPSTWVGAAAAVSDGSSPSMAPSAAVHCLLTQWCGSEVVT